jgi:thioredoxin-related protein
MKVSLITRRVFVTVLIVATVANVRAQGIEFNKTSTWAQIKAEAKKSNKYIFMDCYASWCVPCKKMDMTIYSQKEVGKYFNEHFISVKIQMDSSKGDNEEVRSWYKDAVGINQQYRIEAYPSFLFFSPDGELVHRAVGYQEVEDIIALAKEALDPEKQFYGFVEKYRKGEKDYKVMAAMTQTAKSLRKTALADSLMKDYITNYLPTVKKKEIYRKENISFIADYALTHPTSYLKQLFVMHGKKVDKIMGDNDYSNWLVVHAIHNEEVFPYLPQDTRDHSIPDWAKINNTIKEKYNSKVANQVVLFGKMNFLKGRDWPSYTQYTVLYIEKYGQHMDPFYLNGYANDLFLVNDNAYVLEKALEWSSRCITILSSKNPVDSFDLSNNLDTKANILYRLGRKEEAIRCEEKAVDIAMQLNNGLLLRTYPKILAKMKNEEPTWPDLSK